MIRILSLLIVALLPLILSSCSDVKTEAKYPERHIGYSDPYAVRQTIGGDDGLSLLGGDDDEAKYSINVNSFLWRASLDTIGFMPLASADPFGGTIITDWYNDPSSPNERFKANVFILGPTLRADGIKVRLFKQVKENSDWVSAEVSENLNTEFEDRILTRARQLRAAQAVEKD